MNIQNYYLVIIYFNAVCSNVSIIPVTTNLVPLTGPKDDFAKYSGCIATKKLDTVMMSIPTHRDHTGSPMWSR